MDELTRQLVTKLRREVAELRDVLDYQAAEITELKIKARFALSLMRVRDPRVQPSETSLIEKVTGQRAPIPMVDGYVCYIELGGRDKTLDILQAEMRDAEIAFRVKELQENGDTRDVAEIYEQVVAEYAANDRQEHEASGRSDSESEDAAAIAPGETRH